jgi:hypothetical protein
MIVFGYTLILGFGLNVTLSIFSPSRPIEVKAITSSLYSSIIWFRTVVFPAFFAVPIIEIVWYGSIYFLKMIIRYSFFFLIY